MALDDQQAACVASLQEAYLHAEQRRSTMFATLNQVRQRLEALGAQAQPADPSHEPAASSSSLPPRLWRPDHHSDSIQPGLHWTARPGAGSARVEYRSVNKLHDVVSPAQKLVNGQHRNAALGQNRKPQPGHAGEKSAASASQPQAHRHPIDSVPAAQQTADPQQSDRQQAISSMQTASSNELAVSRPSTLHVQQFPSQSPSAASPSTLHMHQQPPIQSSAAGSPSTSHMQQSPVDPSAAVSPSRTHVQKPQAQSSVAPSAAVSPSKLHVQKPQAQPPIESSAAVSPDKPHMQKPQAESPSSRLTGVRHTPEGWQARLGVGRSKSKKALGTFPTECAAGRAYDQAILIQQQPVDAKKLNFPVSDYASVADPTVCQAAAAAADALRSVNSNKRKHSETRTAAQAPVNNHARSHMHNGQQSNAQAFQADRGEGFTGAKRHKAERQQDADLGPEHPHAHAHGISAQNTTSDSNKHAAPSGSHSQRSHLHQSNEEEPPWARQGQNAGSAARPSRGRLGGLAQKLRGARHEMAKARYPSQVNGQTIRHEGLDEYNAPEPVSTKSHHDAGHVSQQQACKGTSGAVNQPGHIPEVTDAAGPLQSGNPASAGQQQPSAEAQHIGQIQHARHAQQSAQPQPAAQEEQDPPSTASSEKKASAPSSPVTHQSYSQELPPWDDPDLGHGHSAGGHAPPFDQQGPSPLRTPHEPAHSDSSGRQTAAYGSRATGIKGSPDATAHALHAGNQSRTAGCGHSSPEVVETVRAGDSDDDVEIMDYSPVRQHASSRSPSPSGSLQQRWKPQRPPDQQQQNQQQQQQQHQRRRMSAPPKTQQPVPQSNQQGLSQPPAGQQHEPEPAQEHQHSQAAQQARHILQLNRQEQQRHHQSLHQGGQQPQHQPEPMHAHAQQQQQQPVQNKAHPAKLSSLASVLQSVRRQSMKSPIPASAAVKQEAKPSQSHDSAHMPHSDRPSTAEAGSSSSHPTAVAGGRPVRPTAVAGSSSSHPVELSESSDSEGADADSSASSSVDPSQRVPAPWQQADTAASHRPSPSTGHKPSPAPSTGHQAHATGTSEGLVRQQSQGSTPSHPPLRTKRGPSDTPGGPRSKLAKLDPGLARQAAMDSQPGATAEQAVDLDDDDDDDDVVIIEPGMQPPSAAKPAVKPSGTDARPTVGSNSSAMPVVAAMRSAKYGPSTSTQAPTLSSTLAPTATVHNTGPVQSSTLPEKPTVVTGQQSRLSESKVQPGGAGSDVTAGADNASDPGVFDSVLAADGVAELRRTDQHGDASFEAAQKEEWERRQVEVSRQAEEARRLKRLRKAQNEKIKQQQAQIAQRLADHRLDEQRKEAEANQKEKLRILIRQRLAIQLGKAKSLHAVLRAFAIPVEGGLVPTQAQLQKAYKKATILFHPDKHVNAGLQKQLEAEEAFKIISHAAHKQSSK